MFEKKKQDKHKTLFQQLFSSNFAMNVKNRFEIFEKFLTRFTSTINSLRLSNNDKIMHLYRNLFDQLTKKLYHLNEFTKYAEYVKKMRQMTNQMKIRNDIKQTISSSIIDNRVRSTREIETIRKNANSKKFMSERFKIKTQTLTKNMLSRFFAHIRNKFKKNDRCFKCKKKEHIMTDFDVSYQNKNQINREKAKTLFSEMSIKYIEIDFVYFDDAKKVFEYIEKNTIDENDQSSNSKNYAFSS